MSKAQEYIRIAVRAYLAGDKATLEHAIRTYEAARRAGDPDPQAVVEGDTLKDMLVSICTLRSMVGN